MPMLKNCQAFQTLCYHNLYFSFAYKLKITELSCTEIHRMKLSHVEQKILINILGVICVDMVDCCSPGHKTCSHICINIT